MLDKLKNQYNKKYTTISLYVILTVLIIFVLAYITTRLEDAFKIVKNVISYILKLFSPVFVGLIIAYILDPLVESFEKHIRKIKFLKFKNDKKYRTISVISCVVLVLLLIIFLLVAFVFGITKQFSGIKFEEFIELLTNYINSFSDSLIGIENSLAKFNVESDALKKYITDISGFLFSGLSSFANNLAANALNISGFISTFALGIVIAIYLLIDKEEFLRYANIISSVIFTNNIDGKLRGYWHDFDNIFSGYIRGQLMDALLMSVILSITLSIIGIKFGALIGVLAGLCNLIPYFGPLVAFVGTIFFGLINMQYVQVVIAIIALIIIQQIDGTIIGPKLLGNSVSLKPVFILIAVIIGGGIGGVAGMVMAVPVAALIRLFLKRYIRNKLDEKGVKSDLKV